MPHTVPGPRPKESRFYEPIIYLIGRLSGFKPYVGVDHKKIRNDVLRLAGLTLIKGDDGTPTHATDGESVWSLKSSSSKARDGLYRICHFSWYHQTRQYRHENEAKCAKPVFPEIGNLNNALWDLLDLTEEDTDTLKDPTAKTPEKKRIRAKIKVQEGLLHVEDAIYYSEIKGELRELNAVHRGKWALSSLGVKKAKELRVKYEGKVRLSSGPNATAQFIGDNFDKFYDRITNHIRRKMPRSEMFDKVDDHAMNWIDRVIQRDGLRGRIETKKSIAPSQVCAWARRGAYTDIRNEGREPVARVFHGALTPKEVRTRAEVDWIEEVTPRTINDSEILCGTQYTSHSEDNATEGGHIEMVMDQHEMATVEETVGGREAFEVCLGRLSEILYEEIAEEHDPAWHEQLVHDRFVKEMSVREIAAAHGLSFDNDQNRIKVALNRVRDVMLRAREDGELDEFINR